MDIETTTRIGGEGEDHAVRYLLSRGYRIRCRNYRHRKAEIDIIALREGVLVIIEVKTRTGSFYEALTDSITRAKINRLTRAAHHYIQEHRLDCEVRFDIIQVLRLPRGFRLIHLRDAFYFFQLFVCFVTIC